MYKYQGICECGDNQKTAWSEEKYRAAQEIVAHVKAAHRIRYPKDGDDYKVIYSDKCSYCEEDKVDTCGKCNGDFCNYHRGTYETRLCQRCLASGAESARS